MIRRKCFNNLCWRTNRHAVVRDVSIDNRIGANNHVATNMNRSNDYLASANLNVVAKYGNLIKPRRSTDGYVLRDMTVQANHASLVDNDSKRLISEDSSLPNLSLVGNNPPPKKRFLLQS